MEITKKNLTLFISSGLIILTSSLIIFGLDVLKDNPIDAKDCTYPCKIYFTVGVSLLLICLPLLALSSYFLTTISKESEEKKINKQKLNRIYKTCSAIWVLNIIGVVCYLSAFEFYLFCRRVNLGFITLLGYLLSGGLYLLFDKWLPGKDKDN